MAAIVASEILTMLTVAAAAGGTTAQGNPNASLGDQASTTAWAGGVLHDLFDVITGAENAASTVDYRCVAVRNTNAANVFQSVKAWISSETAGGASLAIGADPTAASAYTAGAQQFVTAASETTAPAGVTFSSPTTQGAGVDLGDIGIAQVRGLWFRRTAANTSALSNDGATVSIGGDTGSL